MVSISQHLLLVTPSALTCVEAHSPFLSPRVYAAQVREELVVSRYSRGFGKEAECIRYFRATTVCNVVEPLTNRSFGSVVFRRRKKDEDVGHVTHASRVSEAGRNSSGHKFDLEADAFPPLPAHFVETPATTSSSTCASAASTTTPNQSDHHPADESQKVHWENG